VHTESHAKPATSAWQPMDRSPSELVPYATARRLSGGWTGCPVPSPGGQTGQPFCMSHSEASIGASGAKKDDGVGELQTRTFVPSPLRASPTPSHGTSVEASSNDSFRAERYDGCGVGRVAMQGVRDVATHLVKRDDDGDLPPLTEADSMRRATTTTTTEDVLRTSQG
jgi:hypothetical protein